MLICLPRAKRLLVGRLVALIYLVCVLAPGLALASAMVTSASTACSMTDLRSPPRNGKALTCMPRPQALAITIRRCRPVHHHQHDTGTPVAETQPRPRRPSTSIGRSTSNVAAYSCIAALPASISEVATPSPTHAFALPETRGHLAGESCRCSTIARQSCEPVAIRLSRALPSCTRGRGALISSGRQHVDADHGKARCHAGGGHKAIQQFVQPSQGETCGGARALVRSRRLPAGERAAEQRRSCRSCGQDPKHQLSIGSRTLHFAAATSRARPLARAEPVRRASAEIWTIGADHVASIAPGASGTVWLLLATSLIALGGCASFSPDGGMAASPASRAKRCARTSWRSGPQTTPRGRAARCKRLLRHAADGGRRRADRAAQQQWPAGGLQRTWRSPKPMLVQRQPAAQSDLLAVAHLRRRRQRDRTPGRRRYPGAGDLAVPLRHRRATASGRRNCSAALETLRLAADVRRAYYRAVAANELVGLLTEAQVDRRGHGAACAPKLGETGCAQQARPGARAGVLRRDHSRARDRAPGRRRARANG